MITTVLAAIGVTWIALTVGLGAILTGLWLVDRAGERASKDERAKHKSCIRGCGLAVERDGLCAPCDLEHRFAQSSLERIPRPRGR